MSSLRALRLLSILSAPHIGEPFVSVKIWSWNDHKSWKRFAVPSRIGCPIVPFVLPCSLASSNPTSVTAWEHSQVSNRAPRSLDFFVTILDYDFNSTMNLEESISLFHSFGWQTLSWNKIYSWRSSCSLRMLSNSEFLNLFFGTPLFCWLLCTRTPPPTDIIDDGSPEAGNHIVVCVL